MGIAAKRSQTNYKNCRGSCILTFSSYDADAGYLLQQLGSKDLIAQCQIQVALMVFKALNDPAPDYLSSMFTERRTSGYALRALQTN